MGFKNISIKDRIYAGFFIVFMLTTAIGMMGYFAIDGQIDLNSRNHDTLIPYFQNVQKLKIEALMHRRFEKDFFLNIGNPEKQNKYLIKYEKSSKQLNVHLSEVVRLSGGFKSISNNINTIVDQSQNAYQSYKEGFLSLAKKVLSKPDLTPQEANQRMKPFKENIYAFEDGIDKLIEISDDYARIESESSMASGLLAKRFIVIGFSIAALVACFVSVLICRKLSRLMSGTMSNMLSSSEQVASASMQISTSSQTLAEGASVQASSIEEASASLEEIASMIKLSTDNVSQANGLMKKANQLVSTAGRSIDELTGSMDEITNASKETSKIIKTIDEIAFQTNLLALNAAVEAARAGEAGSGFAVVADEVRNLAMRAAEAAKNTAELIEGTVDKVQNGLNLAEKANKAFSDVTESASAVGGLITEISAASIEQAQGIDQVNQAIAEMDKVTQANAANAEENASASEQMSGQALEIKRFVDYLSLLISGKTDNRDVADHKVPSNKDTNSKQGLTAPQVSKKANNRDLSEQAMKKASSDQIIPFDDDVFEDF